MIKTNSKLQTAGSQQVQQFLLNLGLSEQQAKIYMMLNKKGPLSAHEIAKNTAIPRTSVYRLLEDLKSQKLVTEMVEEHRTLARAVTPDKLELMIKNKQSEIDRMRKLFPQVNDYLEQQISEGKSSTNVRFYRGISGVQQMAWKVLEAKDGIVGYSQSRFSDSVGEKFAKDLFEELFFNKIPMRELLSDNYVESVGGKGNLGQEILPPFDKYIDTRYIPNSKLTITHSMDIYNDTLAIYDWQGDDVFGVIIENPKVANMQRQLFELAWSQGVAEKELIGKKLKIS